MGHPLGLYVLFFTEMWERFSYYGMRALLTLYMAHYLLKDPQKMASIIGFTTLNRILELGFGHMDAQPLSSQLYALYTGFVYLSPFFGGILADKVWGRRKSVYVGAILMGIGHFMMASEKMFLLALFFLILGNGAFKPNISTQVGNLYPQGDPRRDGAFTIFYIGINLGGFLAPLVCGTLGQSSEFGWHYGFGAAGVGMFLGLLCYHFGRHYLPLDKMDQPTIKGAENPSLGAGFATKTIFGFFAVAALFFVIIILPAFLKLVLIACIIGGAAWAISKLKGDERNRVIALVLLCIATICFWSIYEQQGNTMQLWADEKTDWMFFGKLIPSTWFQSLNSLMIFMFAPFLDLWWNLRAKKGSRSSSIRKMGVGCVLTGLAFVVMIFAAKWVGADPSAKGSVLWLVITTWIVTLGELYLSPIGLSFVTKVSPPRMISMMMGMWFLSSFLGNYLSGYIGMFYEKMPKETFFLLLSVIGFAIGGVFFLAEKPLKKVVGDA